MHNGRVRPAPSPWPWLTVAGTLAGAAFLATRQYPNTMTPWHLLLVGLAGLVLGGALICSRQRRLASLATASASHERDATARYRTLLDNIPGAAFRCTAQASSRVDFVSDGVQALTGYPGAALLDGSIRWKELVLAEDLPLLRRATGRAIKARTPYEIEYRIRHADGGIRWLHEKGRASYGEDGEPEWLDGVIIDITDRKEFETALRSFMFRQQALQQLDRAILEASTPEEVAAKVLLHLAEQVPFSGAVALAFDAATGDAVPLARYGSTDLGGLWSQAGCSCAGQLGHAEFRIVPDLGAGHDGPAELDDLCRQGVRSFMCITLAAEGQLVGALRLFSDQADFFGATEVENVRLVADVLAIALQQALLRQRLHQEAARLEERVAQRTAELEGMKNQAEAASRAKSRFLTQLSHALRTPLNSLLILSELLIENTQGNLTPEQVEFARIIQDAGGDLRLLINDILDISKIEAGRAALHYREVSFVEILGYVESRFRKTAESKGLGFEMELAADLPAALHTDFDYLKPILRNLIANAIQFTESGSVAVKVHPAAADGPAHGAEQGVAFDIIDTGVGIAADQLPKLLDFAETPASGPAINYSASGLGLHVARVNAELLAGELTVRSAPGQGSTFTLWLPWAEVPAGPA